MELYAGLLLWRGTLHLCCLAALILMFQYRAGGAAGLSLTRSGSPAVPPPAEDDRVLTPGRSLTPMTPKRPPKGLVLPNAFGLLSMQSFKSQRSAPSTIDEARLFTCSP